MNYAHEDEAINKYVEDCESQDTERREAQSRKGCQMADEVRTCVECQGSMSPVIIMDRSPGLTRRVDIGELEYRLPDDRVSFWTGQYPTAGKVRAFMCEGCGRIALYGGKPDA